MLFFFGLICFLFTHLWKISEIPGFHYDEAWAANYSYRIAFEQNFWPLTAMSPYTAPWAHYGAALFFKVFGVSLGIFRTSQIFFVFLGICFSSLALQKIGEKFAASLLPLFVAFFPVLVMNHRFAIEMNGFHVLCLGILLYALASKNSFFCITAAIFGVTSHVLFLAPLLAIVFLLLLQTSMKGMEVKWRVTVVISALCLLPFFVFMAKNLEKANKAYSLIALSIVIVVWFGYAINTPKLIENKKEQLLKFFAIASLPFVLNALFFSSTTLSLFFTNGLIQEAWVQIFFIFVYAAFLMTLYLSRHYRDLPQPYVFFFFFTTLFAGLMMLKPAPRYFEVPLLLMCMLFLLILSRLPKPKSFALLCLLLGTGFLSLGKNYGLVQNTQYGVEQEFKILWYKDSYLDFLPKQKLSLFLGLNGCRLSDIVTGDGRVYEALRFLEHSDWPVEANKDCGGPWRVERLLGDIRLQAEPEIEFFGFGLWKEKQK